MMPYPEEKLQRAAAAMRNAFFDVVGDVDNMNVTEQEEAVHALMAIHAGEMIEIAACFGTSPPLGICIDLIDAMIVANANQIDDLRKGERDTRGFLAGEQP